MMLASRAARGASHPVISFSQQMFIEHLLRAVDGEISQTGGCAQVAGSLHLVWMGHCALIASVSLWSPQELVALWDKD